MRIRTYGLTTVIFLLTSCFAFGQGSDQKKQLEGVEASRKVIREQSDNLKRFYQYRQYLTSGWDSTRRELKINRFSAASRRLSALTKKYQGIDINIDSLVAGRIDSKAFSRYIDQQDEISVAVRALQVKIFDSKFRHEHAFFIEFSVSFEGRENRIDIEKTNLQKAVLFHNQQYPEAKINLGEFLQNPVPYSQTP